MAARRDDEPAPCQAARDRHRGVRAKPGRAPEPDRLVERRGRHEAEGGDARELFAEEAPLERTVGGNRLDLIEAATERRSQRVEALRSIAERPCDRLVA